MSERLYLLGHPVAHSKSPVMHNALYRKLGLSWQYDLMDCADEEGAKGFIEKRSFLGINITTPYKPLAFSCANVRASSAKLARGANVLAAKGEALIAYNMDGEGCISFLERSGVAFNDAVVVVCGTGPTSLAILHAAALAGAKKLVLIGRNKERSQKALQGYLKEFGTLAYATIALPPLHKGHLSFREAYDKAAFSFGSYRSAQNIFKSADVIINATPIGMKVDQKIPFNTELLHEGQTVFDVVYGHGRNMLLEAAEKQGCKTFGGAGMLVAQAVASARVFFDMAGVADTMSDTEMFDIMAHAAGFEC